MFNIKKVFKSRICILSIFVIGLIILNISLNLSVPVISDDDSDSILGQLDVASNFNKHLSYVNAWGQSIFSVPVTGKNEIIPLSTVCNPVLGFTIYNRFVLGTQLRAPPLDIGSFG